MHRSMICVLNMQHSFLFGKIVDISQLQADEASILNAENDVTCYLHDNQMKSCYKISLSSKIMDYFRVRNDQS